MNFMIEHVPNTSDIFQVKTFKFQL